MAKYLITVWPYLGSLNPLTAVGHALSARGHSVAYYSGHRTQAFFEGEGFTFFPLSQELNDFIERMLVEPEGAGRGWSGRPWEAVGMLRAFFLEPIRAEMADLDGILANWKPDVVLCEPAMWAPILILHEAREIPVAMYELPATTMPGRGIPPGGLGLPLPRNWRTRLQARLAGAAMDVVVSGVRRDASRLRQEFGLPPLESSVMALTGKLPLVLVPSSPEFDYQRHDLPATFHYIGHCVSYPSANKPFGWLETLPHDWPWVHVSEGTMYVQEPIVLRKAAQALAGMSLHVIMTTGTQRDPATIDLGPLASNILVEPWVPYSQLFPKTDLVVTHGGGGTVIAALAAGLPMVVLPLMWDQADNAQRVVEAGAGVRLSAESCTPTRLRAAVAEVLSEPSYRRNAQRLADSLACYGGPDQAAELLEQLLEQPV